MTDNPFNDAQAWSSYLGEGDHIVTIESAEDASSQQGKPQIALVFANAQGSKQDWCNYSSDFLAKVVALFDAAGIPRPQDGEFDPNDNFRLTSACIQRLVGKRLGIVIRPEPDFNDATVMRDRVQNYIPANRIDGGPDDRGLPAVPRSPSSQPPGSNGAPSPAQQKTRPF